MRDLFSEDRGLDLPRGTNRTGIDPAGMGQSLGDGGRYPLEGRHVCPFCGTVNETMEGPCPQCTMTNTAETRKATKSRIGPWYVLQSRNPAAPGMRYETLLGFVRKGRVKARSIVRGPTTHQLWRFACQVKGLSREFGLCYSCGNSVERDAQVCPQCNRLQDPPTDPDTFLEGQSSPPLAAAEPAALGPRPSPMEALQETTRAPIFKELKLPPLSEFPAITPPAPAPRVVAPTPTAPPTPAPAARAAEAPAGPAAPVEAAPEPAPPRRRPATPAAAVPPAASAAPLPADPRVIPPPRQVASSPAPEASMPSMPVSPSDGPPKRNANDVFLSAKDLAAAFQLGFDADKAAKAADDSDRSASWSGPGRANAPRAYRRPRRKRRTGRKILLVLVLLVIGAGAFVALNLRARTAVAGWAQAKWMAVTGANLYPDLVNKNPANKTPGATGGPAPAPGAQRTAPAGVSASALPAEPPDPLTAAAPAPRAASQPAAAARATPSTSQPAAGSITREPVVSSPLSDRVVAAPDVATPPAARHTPTTVPSPSPAAVVPPPSSPRPAPAQTRPAPPRDTSAASAPPTRNEPAPARMTREEAQRKSRELWNQALDAEERGDFRRAKELYQTIMATLPEDVWFKGIEARLKVAREVLGEK